jgi:hypothetical protein
MTNMKPRPRPSDIDEFSASCVNIKNKAMVESEARTKFEDFNEKNKLVEDTGACGHGGGGWPGAGWDNPGQPVNQVDTKS